MSMDAVQYADMKMPNGLPARSVEGQVNATINNASTVLGVAKNAIVITAGLSHIATMMEGRISAKPTKWIHGSVKWWSSMDVPVSSKDLTEATFRFYSRVNSMP